MNSLTICMRRCIWAAVLLASSVCARGQYSPALYTDVVVDDGRNDLHAGLYATGIGVTAPDYDALQLIFNFDSQYIHFLDANGSVSQSQWIVRPARLRRHATG